MKKLFWNLFVYALVGTATAYGLFIDFINGYGINYTLKFRDEILENHIKK